LNGTCEQLFSRLLFPATANFQKREYEERTDAREERRGRRT
jgi:hypothetical protein